MAARHGTDWQRLYAANRDVIGDDPDVIVPGQRLDL
ncbi:LysM peptidoglycan-binding domain-containing protein [Streptomyces albogriseolus]|nr:LysM peptidoglycan-binding domain-containing protein [Streptomyces albogriseolus]